MVDKLRCHDFGDVLYNTWQQDDHVVFELLFNLHDHSFGFVHQTMVTSSDIVMASACIAARSANSGGGRIQ